jgi:sugar lactone lactonase YvrE
MRAIAPPVDGRAWLSVHPVDPSELSNRVLLVAFWSLGCEASLQLVREVETLADFSGGQVAALAIHTPRFPYEEDEATLRSTLAEHRIELPVVHDPDYVTWNRYNPGGWPAVAVIDRFGRVIGLVQGLQALDTLEDVITAELSAPLPRRGQRGGYHSGPTRSGDGGRPTVLTELPDLAGDESLALPEEWLESSLAFPAGLAIDGCGLLAVSDTGNDRLLVGAVDSDLRTFRPEMEITDLDQPTDVVFASDDLLFVIERGTSSVLRIDLEAGAVDVVLDDEVDIPRALLADDDGSLLIADAGSDRLLRLTGATTRPDAGAVVLDTLAGTGRSGHADGRGRRAQLAQPVAMTHTAGGVAFCDAASSNVRLLSRRGAVHTVTGSDFFEWGLVDGPAHEALLQRPGGLATDDAGTVYVADTGNHRIRRLQDRRLATLGLAGLRRPTALQTLASGHLLIADTGNHRVVVADPTGKTAWPLSVYPAALTSIWADEAPVD